MENEILTKIGEYGVLGLVLMYALWDNFKMKSKLFKIIENNTKALTELKIFIENKING